MHSFDYFQICQWHWSNSLNEAFQWAAESNRTLRQDYFKLKHPFSKTATVQNLLSFFGPSKWNKLPESPKKCILKHLSSMFSRNFEAISNIRPQYCEYNQS